MKKSLIAAAAVMLGVSGAHAADIAARPYTKAPVPAAAYDWSGFYVGVNAGYGWDDRSVSYVPNNAIMVTGSTFPSSTWNNSGALGGVQIGYNRQIGRQWVAGVETDINASDIKGSAVATSPVSFGAAFFAASQKVDWFGTVRARLGWLPSDRFLVFATGGLAYGHVGEDISLTRPSGVNVRNGVYGFSCSPNETCFAGASSGVRAGWTAGAGFEYALLQNLTAKAEYLYVDLGGNSVIGTAFRGNGGIPASYTANFSSLSFNIVRAGLNYRF
ncbi:outer membrane protein [Bradyrhizobium sp.]|uniref:outer membrane protein n=1 Tax=Bradyrhizobium sp. TaxID=376 RepID=UPI0039E22001